MGRTMPLTIIMYLMVLVNTAVPAATEDATVNQEDNQRQPKYSFPSQYLSLHGAPHPFVYQLPGMPLPLSYLPGQHVPGVITAAAPAFTPFIQRLVYPTAAIPLATIPHYPTTDEGVQFIGETRGDATTCITAATECLEYLESLVPTIANSGLPRSMMQADDQALTFARNPVLQPIVLEERGDLPATYGGPLLSCVTFALKLPLNPQCISELPDPFQPLFCAVFRDILAPLFGEVSDVCNTPTTISGYPWGP